MHITILKLNFKILGYYNCIKN